MDIQTQRSNYVKFFSFVTLLLSALFLFSSKASAAPANFTVTNVNDSGAGSLRQAILDANGNGNSSDMDVIEFNIAGSEVHTINIATDLPVVTQKLTINGYSQPGAQENTAVSPEPINSVIKIEIAGTNATITQGALGLAAADSVVKGLAIYDASEPSPFEKVTLWLGGTRSSVKGSYIGLRADGFTAGQDYKNSTGVIIGADDVVVGGSNPEDRNVIFAKSVIGQSAGIAAGGSGTIIYGNYIGIARDGVTDLTPEQADANGFNPPFSMGINLIGDYGTNAVGGAGEGEGNVISGNSAGVIISSPNNVIQGNYIGTNYQGAVSSSITNGNGIASTNGSNSIIGGTGTSEGNVIAGVMGSGIEIAEMTIQPISHTITPSKIAALGNSIYGVKQFNLLGIGDSNLGIDISRFVDTTGDFIPDEFFNRGPTPNDSEDIDTGPNGIINTPVLKTAQQVGNQLTVTYDLDAADSPSNTYRVEFFANDAASVFGYGPGQTYLGAVTSATNGTNKTAVLTVNGDFTDKALSATTTAIDNTTSSGFGATSEFAKNISVGSESDFDSDGASDAVENAAPNGGDGNNDGIQDSQQPTVTSYVIDATGVYATLVTTGCSENGTVASVDLSTLQVKDNGYRYPYGLTDFILNCSRGDTVNVTMYVHKDDDPEKYIPRKFITNHNNFTELSGAAVSKEVLGASTAIKLTYSVQDGGDFDDDGEVNGIIVDPVGLAVENSGVLANTGAITGFAIFVGVVMLAGALYTYQDYRRHKKPLLEIDPKLARSYTYWHHLRVVSVPLVKYRLQIKVEKRQVIPSNDLS